MKLDFKQNNLWFEKRPTKWQQKVHIYYDFLDITANDSQSIISYLSPFLNGRLKSAGNLYVAYLQNTCLPHKSFILSKNITLLVLLLFYDRLFMQLSMGYFDQYLIIS